MDKNTATEIAYKNGYEQGMKDAARQEWISVDERLPEESGDYLTFHERGSYGELYYNANIKMWNVYFAGDKRSAIRSVTHWMPLPEPLQRAGDALGRATSALCDFVREFMKFAAAALPELVRDARVQAALMEAPPRVRHLALHSRKYRTRKKNINRALREYQRRK